MDPKSIHRAAVSLQQGLAIFWQAGALGSSVGQRSLVTWKVHGVAQIILKGNKSKVKITADDFKGLYILY